MVLESGEVEDLGRLVESVGLGEQRLRLCHELLSLGLAKRCPAELLTSVDVEFERLVAQQVGRAQVVLVDEGVGEVDGAVCEAGVVGSAPSANRTLWASITKVSSS